MLSAQRGFDFEEREMFDGRARPASPRHRDELRSPASILPRARLYLGANAICRVLCELGRGSRFVPIATHRIFGATILCFRRIRPGDAPV